MPSPPTILIAGLGETGAELARRLSDHLPVLAIEIEADQIETAREIVGQGETLSILHGDATSALVQRRSGAETLRAAVACTGSDETNLEALRVAGQVFGATERVALLRRSFAL